MAEIPQRLIVVGASGGIGQALTRALLDEFPAAQIYATHNRSAIPFHHERVDWRQLDVVDPDAIETWAAAFDRVDWIINCVGFLHGAQGGPEKNIRSLEPEFLLDNIKINTLPSLLLARNFAAPLKKSPAPLLATISARVGSIEDRLVQLSYFESRTQHGAQDPQHRMAAQPPQGLRRRAASGHQRHRAVETVSSQRAARRPVRSVLHRDQFRGLVKSTRSIPKRPVLGLGWQQTSVVTQTFGDLNETFKIRIGNSAAAVRQHRLRRLQQPARFRGAKAALRANRQFL
jgi:NAD(P)-dependent dehydrogenase (short-subunit alcohol dehydrogenase family)